jgi:DNA-binding MurR/RpiR family transcriptional regulator
MNGGLARLREAMTHLSPSEKKVATYILENPHEVVGLSVAQLAELSQSSQAAIIRLCNRVDIKSFPELKVRIAVDLQENQTEDYQEVEQTDTVESIIRKVTNNNINSIRDSIKILDLSSLERAIDAIVQAERVFFYGISTSGLVAQDAQQKFLRINKTAFAFPDVDLQRTSAVVVSHRDVVVGISYSGETDIVNKSLRIAKQNGATVIGISKLGPTTLNSIADISVNISAYQNELISGPTFSRIALFNTIDILYLSVATRTYQQSLTYLEKTRSVSVKNS